MGSLRLPKRARRTAPELPDNVMHAILSQLNFRSKISAGQVCKKWDQLLKAGNFGTRHWEVDYKVHSLVARTTRNTTDEEVPSGDELDSMIGSWFANRAAAIKHVHVSATLSSDLHWLETVDLLERHLPLLAGCLSVHVSTMDLSFSYRSPFNSPLLSSPAFLTLLCPMVKSLCLVKMQAISRAQFAAICQLSTLTELVLDTWGPWKEHEEGREKVTLDIGNLVNLKKLDITIKGGPVTHIPDSISCLQSLEHFGIYVDLIKQLPDGLAMLPSLASIRINCLLSLRLPPSLQGLKSLANVKVTGCELDMIPEAITDLTTLTRLNVSGNYFGKREGWTWWPTKMTRLTRLVELTLVTCDISSLPPHISALALLTILDMSVNNLGSLPEELTSLHNLKALILAKNDFPDVPVSVLSRMTALNTINLRYNGTFSGGVYIPLKIPSPLVPILHSGLVMLDIRQCPEGYLPMDMDDSGIDYEVHKWDPVSFYHLGRAMAVVANRRPLPTLLF